MRILCCQLERDFEESRDACFAVISIFLNVLIDNFDTAILANLTSQDLQVESFWWNEFLHDVTW